MKVIFSPEAVERLESQVQFIRDQNAPDAAHRLQTRVRLFLENHLARFPRLGRKIDTSELWEAWIPKTSLVVWYEIHEDHVAIVSVWHTAQDRFRAV